MDNDSGTFGTPAFWHAMRQITTLWLSGVLFGVLLSAFAYHFIY